jgi:hypothetical protein
MFVQHGCDICCCTMAYWHTHASKCFHSFHFLALLICIVFYRKYDFASLAVYWQFYAIASFHTHPKH